MAKQGGLGDRLFIGGHDLSGDIQALDKISGGPALWDTTDITQSAHSRIGTLRDGSMAFTGFFDSALAHPVLSALPTGDVIMSYLRGTTLANPAACLNAKQVGYDPTRSAAGELLLKTEGHGSGYGLEWGLQLTAGLRTDTAATAGTAVDYGAGSAFGGQAYLQVTAFTGTDATVKVQHSANNSSWSDLITFTQTTGAPGSQRATVANTTTVSRYLRATTVTTGGFTSASFAVVFCRNPAAGVTF